MYIVCIHDDTPPHKYCFVTSQAKNTKKANICKKESGAAAASRSSIYYMKDKMNVTVRNIAHGCLSI